MFKTSQLFCAWKPDSRTMNRSQFVPAVTVPGLEPLAASLDGAAGRTSFRLCRDPTQINRLDGSALELLAASPGEVMLSSRRRREHWAIRRGRNLTCQRLGPQQKMAIQARKRISCKLGLPRLLRPLQDLGQTTDVPLPASPAPRPIGCGLVLVRATLLRLAQAHPIGPDDETVARSRPAPFPRSSRATA